MPFDVAVRLWQAAAAWRSGTSQAPVPAGSTSRACAPRGCISLGRLAHSVDSHPRGYVVGYVALIGTSKVVVSGLARTAADPPKLARDRMSW